MISQIFPRNGRISGLEVGDGARPEVPTTYLGQKKKNNLYFMKRRRLNSSL